MGGGRSLGRCIVGPAARAGRWVIALGLLVTFPACHQVTTYRPESLPPQWSALALPSATELDLTQLAAQTAPDPRIVPGDVLRVFVEVGPGLDRENQEVALRVRDDGTIAVPLIGPVSVAGTTLGQAERAIRDAAVSRGIYRSPQVTLLREARRQFRVTVMGAVADPGLQEIPAGECHLLAALMQAGGLTEDAAPWVKIQRPRSGGVGERVDLRHPERLRDVRLGDGDTVLVERRSPASVYVMGLVRRPQEIELAPGKSLRLLDAIAAAGGRRLQIADKVRIMRYRPDQQEPVVIEASVREAKQSRQGNIVLAAGDVVSVEETPLTFTVETLQSFVRFGFSSAIPFF